MNGAGKKPNRKFLLTVSLIFFSIIAVFFLQYLGTVGRTRNKEVASQLSEVYGQINHQFYELSQKNWNLLSDGALAYQISGSEEMMDSYIAQLKKQWKFNKWLFINEKGACIDTKGNSGYLNLGRDFILLNKDKENIVVDGTPIGTEPSLLFAIPVEKNVYKDFEYTSVALAYDKEAMRQVLDNSSYEGSSECYLIYPDGRILISLQEGKMEYKNLYTLLKDASYDRTDFEEIRKGIHDGEKATCRFHIGKDGYYLYYQPMGFQNWMMVGIVPHKSVGKYVDKIVRQTMILSILTFTLLCSVASYLIYSRNRRAMEIKNREISYRESMFEVLSANTSIMFIVMIPGGNRAEYVSTNAEQVIGIPADEIKKDINLVRNVEFLTKDDVTWERLEDIPLGGIAAVESVRPHGKTGEKRWFEELIYHVEIGDIERFIFLLQDKTEDRRNQANLKTALDIAKAANESKSAFLSNMSHDIRTPMNVIIGFLPLLQRDAENPEKVREYARKINASSRHLLGLINDILDMSKIESGKTSLNIREFKLAELLENVVTIMRPQAAAREQEFEVFVRDIRHEYLMGDSMKISQILVNILSNAVKYTPEGGHIALTVQQLPQMTKNIASLRFIISDDGIGMSKEYQNRIFEPFTRELTRGVKAKGTGLGMPIVKNLVDLMGGSITIDSNPGIGSVFTVDLGIKIRETEVDQDFWIKHSLSRTLVVDDDKDICDNVVQTVMHSGLDMEYALSGREALDKIQRACEEKREYNLVLLDWKMPDMDGLETAACIRKMVPEDVPILILTAYDWSQIEEEARQIGVDGFLEKPFFLSNFMDTVEHICGSAQLEAEENSGDSILRGMRFLVAEDYSLNAEILCGILDMYGVSCDVCVNGLETLRRFEASEAGTYDLILMDIQMPVMNGYDATVNIRDGSHPEAKTIPIIAMSANAFSEDVKKAMEVGMDDYLTKPVDAKLIETTLIKILNTRAGGKT